MSPLALIGARLFGGRAAVLQHDSAKSAGPCGSPPPPPQARLLRSRCWYFLSGLTCTEENFPVKGMRSRLRRNWD